MDDNIIRTFTLDIERQRIVIEALKKSASTSKAALILMGALLILNSVETYFLDKEVKELKERK